VRFELFRDKKREWRFRPVARNGKIIGMQGYKRKANAVKAINLMRKCHLWAVIEK